MAAPRISSFDPQRLRMARAGSQHLGGTHAGTACDLVRAVAGIQAQDASAARLGVRVRSKGLTAADLEKARSVERSVVRSWFMRGTVHLVATEDLPIYEALFTAKELAWSRKRLTEAFDLGPEAQKRIVTLTRKLLEREGLVARKDLLDHLAASGIVFERASTGHHLPRLAVLAGIACFGPERGRETTYVLRADWLAEQPRLDPQAAAAELARRYVGAFGPADERDFAAFSGLGVRTCRSAFEAIAPELEEVRVGEGSMWILRKEARRPLRKGTVALVAAFDNHLLSHVDREFAITAENRPAVWPGGGIIRPTLLVDGMVAGVWRTKRAKGAIDISVAPFTPLSDHVWQMVATEVADIGRFEGLESSLRR